ncbi:hypothetical protein [Haloarcula sp. H-GB5]
MLDTNTSYSAVAIALLIMSAGCSGFVGGSGPTEQTAAPTQTPAATPEPTPKATETLTSEPTAEATESSNAEPIETESDREELTKTEKFAEFDEDMHRMYRITNRSGVLEETETFPENDTYHVTVNMRDTTNRTKTVTDRRDPLLNYYALVANYNENTRGFDEEDHTYIPDTVNVTFVTEDGEMFETRYIKYVWAWKYSTGDWSMTVYAGKYAGTVKKGPGYHEKWK